MSVVDSVLQEIQALNVPDCALTATAVAMAEMVDDQSNSATSRSLCAKVLMDAMSELRAMAPPVKREDRVDEIRQRRERRLRATH